MSSELDTMVEQLNAVTAETRAVFGGLDERQLNWKPAPESWSVAQCFEHLIKTNEGFFPRVDQLLSGEHKASLLEKWSPLSGFFGRMIVKTLEPGSGRKFKAAPKFQPSSSRVGRDILERFAAQQARMAEMMKMSGRLDLKRTIVTSPIASFVTYSLLDAYRVVVTHERRHFEQARRVTEAEGFPK